MPRKKKQKQFRAVATVKEMARERIGTPKPSQVLVDEKKKRAKRQKPTLNRLLEEQ